MIRTNDLVKQIRQIESDKKKYQRELEREKRNFNSMVQKHEGTRRKYEVVKSRTKLMEENLARIKETNYHKNMEIKELELRLASFRKEYSELKDKMDRGNKLYGEVRGNFLNEVRKMNQALFKSKKFYATQSIKEKTRKLKEELLSVNIIPVNEEEDEAEVMRLVEDNERMEKLAVELQQQIKQFDKMELDNDDDIQNENSVEEERVKFQEMLQEKGKLSELINVETEKMKEFEKEYILLKNDVETGLNQMSEFFCQECNDPLSTLQ